MEQFHLQAQEEIDPFSATPNIWH